MTSRRFILSQRKLDLSKTPIGRGIGRVERQGGLEVGQGRRQVDRAAAPLLNATANPAPTYPDTASSNAVTAGPPVSQSPPNTLDTARMSASSID